MHGHIYGNSISLSTQIAITFPVCAASSLTFVLFFTIFSFPEIVFKNITFIFYQPLPASRFLKPFSPTVRTKKRKKTKIFSLYDLFITKTVDFYTFGSVHRAHASTVGIPTNLPENALGFLVEKEVNMLGRAVDNPVSPFVAILGGAKVSDKIAVIENMLDKADKVIVGGGMAYTFAKANGHEVGNSLLEEDKIELAKTIMAKGKDKLILPVDTVIADKFDNDADRKVVEGDIPEGWMGLDIGPKTIELFKDTLQGAKTVVWNGPMGVFEMPNFANGTLSVCEAISELPDAITVIGGGDSAAAAIQLGFEDKFSHISTGGGASLEYMEGKTLPGIAIIAEA